MTTTTSTILAMQSNPCEALTLSSRAQTILQHHRIETVAELIRYTPSRLKGLQGCGAVSVMEIKYALSRHGLELKPDPQEDT